MLVFLADRTHYLDHLAGIFSAYPGDKILMVRPGMEEKAEKMGLDYSVFRNSSSVKLPGARFGVVAGYSSIHAFGGNLPLIKFEHGSGQTLITPDLSWQRIYPEAVKFSVVPNEAAFRKTLSHNAHLKNKVFIGGSPKMDALLKLPRSNPEYVAFSWHWGCNAAPEVRGGFDFWKTAAAGIEGHKVLFHGHPRIQKAVERYCEARNVVFEPDFSEVCRLAKLYVCDFSSTIYEFAAVGGEVLLLNNPWFRTNVEHGQRFWNHANMGVQCNSAGTLQESVELALSLNKNHAERRNKIVEEVFPYLGRSVDRCVSILTAIVKGESDNVEPGIC